MKSFILVVLQLFILFPIYTRADSECPDVTIGFHFLQFKKELKMPDRTIPSSLSVGLIAVGTPLRGSRLAMLTLNHALDETGDDLIPPVGNPLREYLIDGSNSLMMAGDPKVIDFRRGDRWIYNDAANLYVNVLAPSGEKTKVKQMDGYVEFFIPRKDPNAMVVINDVKSKLGKEINDTSLRNDGISLTVYSEEQFLKLTGYLDKFPAPPAESLNGLAVRIDGDASKVLDIRFQDSHDLELPTSFGNRASMSGYAKGMTGELRRIGFKGPPPNDTKLVVFLKTQKAMLKVPFKINDLSMKASERG